MSAPRFPPRTLALLVLAMMAFAANSILTRAALGPGSIDPASFASLRAVSAAIFLSALLFLRGDSPTVEREAWFPAAMLLAYLVFFSFAYTSLSTATGALILFGLVQITMFGMGFWRGERVSGRGALGLMLAASGLVYLLLPGVAAPDPFGAVLMAVAGVAWGFYSLAGRGASDPLKATTANFLLVVPAVIVTNLVFIDRVSVTMNGALLAVASGALASGCGYAIWYSVLPTLSSGQAAMVQLSAPALAAIGGVLFLAEPFTARLVIASTLILGGIFLALRERTS